MASLETITFSYGGKTCLNQHNLNILKPTNKSDSLNHSIIFKYKNICTKINIKQT